MHPIDPAATELLHRLMPLTRLLGLDVERSTPDEVVVIGSWSPDRCTTGGALHGGFLMALADATGAACAAQHLPAGAITTTIQSATSFFRPVVEGRVRATATPVHTGRRTIVVQTDVRRDDGTLVTRTTQTQAVIEPLP
ncbi:MAG: PaaI family thioesterase [Ilumatobacteraceae bacterium]|nr:PaaI family thioesterase [Ilumatobacteraceae bacterium]